MSTTGIDRTPAAAGPPVGEQTEQTGQTDETAVAGQTEEPQQTGETGAATASDAATGGRWQPDWRRGLVFLAPALLYVGVREVGLLVLTWLAARNGIGVTSALTSWDGQWYLGIAAGGYGHVPAGLADAFGHRSAITPLAFFPGYPALVRWLSYLPGVDLVSSAFAVSVTGGVFAAYALARLGRVAHSTRAGLILVVLFAASPMAIVLSMAYSESVFCALAAWALVGVVERRWVAAGLCAAAAGLLRPTAAAVVAVVVAAAVVAIVRRRDSWRPWAGAVLAPLGLLGYLGYVALCTGSPTGWFQLQRDGWNSAFDGGVATVRFGLDVLATGRSVLEVGTVAVLVVAVALLVIAIRERIAWPLWLYGLLVLVMDVGSNGLMNSKARLLLPAFTLLLPAAIALTRRRRGTMLVVLAGVVLASAWFGGYAITGWTYAI